MCYIDIKSQFIVTEMSMLDSGIKFLLTTFIELKATNIDLVLFNDSLVISDDSNGFDSDQLSAFVGLFLKAGVARTPMKKFVCKHFYPIEQMPKLMIQQKDNPENFHDIEGYRAQIIERSYKTSADHPGIFCLNNWVWYHKSVKVKIFNRHYMDTFGTLITVNNSKLNKISRSFKTEPGIYFQIDNKDMRRRFSEDELEDIIMKNVNEISNKFPDVMFRIK